jgi:hypothetical protein
VLDEPIFARVIGNHGESPSRLQLVAQERQRSLEYGELLVNGNSNRLEEAREIAGTHAGAERSADRVNKVVTHMHWFSLPAMHDLPGQAIGTGLVSVFAKDVG